MGKYFGTDGFRGEANKDLTAIHAFRLGRFLGSYYHKEGERCRVVIGKDTRDLLGCGCVPFARNDHGVRGAHCPH